ncbi:hypothetical protein [Thalassospira sp.]|uniref:hypothetical protein n=1 Tax=Thalassospira sp. TaxID=1912094 RepID=UPI0025DDB7D5|nr:hypothetical protein [Thalassospira sp.]
MPAVIHVKLSGEGDFGPVDLECAIPPARLPVVMAALFGQAPSGAGMMAGPVSAGPAVRAQGNVQSASDDGRSVQRAESGATVSDSAGRLSDDYARDAAGGGTAVGAGQPVSGYGGDLAVSGAIDPGMFITGFVGSFGDLVARLQPRGFAETILLAAIWLQYRDGRSFVTRGDVRRLLRRQDHLRMPRNFSRDFHAAVLRGYLEEVENEDGYTVAGDGFQWFRQECRK